MQQSPDYATLGHVYSHDVSSTNRVDSTSSSWYAMSASDLATHLGIIIIALLADRSPA
jgi:hypothetical protein